MKKIALIAALILPLPAVAQSQVMMTFDQDFGAFVASQQASNRAAQHAIESWKAVVMENSQLQGGLAKAQARVKELEDKYEKTTEPKK